MEATAANRVRPVPVRQAELFESAGTLELRLHLSDPEVVAELRRLPPGAERERFAAAALRIGVLSLRMAGGQVDGDAIHQAGQALMSRVQELLSTRAAELTGQLATSLAQYLDPQTGLLPQRLDALVKEGGELDRVIRAQVGANDSVLARSLAASVGEQSALFKMLSPTEASGVRMQLAQTLEEALGRQREHILGEFSLDSKDSALSRLIAELSERHTELGEGLKGQVESVVKEFSLDQPNSALSRLVGRVELAQRAIVDQFSSDNQDSALSRLARMLQQTSQQIGETLTLDDEASPLSRLKRELSAQVGELQKNNQQFHGEVRETLAALRARRDEAARTATHGLEFEARLGLLLGDEAQRVGDLYEPTGARTGLIKNNKTGDFVTELGPDTRTPGARIVWEAKEDKGYTMRRALEEIDEARRNRGAQIGVFVFSRATAPPDAQPFQRFGEDLIVVWDADERLCEVVVKTAYHCARALTVAVKVQSESAEQALSGVEQATRSIEKQVGYLDDIRTAAETIRNSGVKIIQRAEKMHADLETEVERLDRWVGALRHEDEG